MKDSTRSLLRKELRDGLLSIGVGMPSLGVAIFGGFFFVWGWADGERGLDLAFYAVLFLGGLAGRWGSDVLRARPGEWSRASALAYCFGLGFAGAFWLMVLLVIFP